MVYHRSYIAHAYLLVKASICLGLYIHLDFYLMKTLKNLKILEVASKMSIYRFYSKMILQNHTETVNGITDITDTFV